jgi:tRNA(Ile)-lysidine synthase
MESTQLLLPTSSLLIQKKNLLAFSGGVDSSALFFLLLEHKIPFDIALVNYGTRENSDKEEEHAKALAKKYGKACHTRKAPLFESHFEANARDFRYAFFEEIIQKEGYETLLTAHQLNDQLEWLLMRLSKGAGLSELLGLETITQKEHYLLVRPLLEQSKEELLAYLHQHDHPYFIDESNSDEKYERNYFRKKYADPLLEEYKEGIKRSFAYLKADKKRLESQYELLYRNKKLRILKLHEPLAKVHAADITLKSLGYLLSASQRQEIAKENSLVIGGMWVVEVRDNLLYMAPYRTLDMPKDFKEQCRVQKIPSKIRPYLFEEGIEIDRLP